MNEFISVVTETFIVICGVAVTQFFTGGTVVDTDPIFKNASKLWYWICYVLALIVVVTLALRFLIGSRAQLSEAYPTIKTFPAFRAFVTDVSFLMFFGAFLVGAALAKTVRAFMGWLTVLSAAGVVWSSVALWRGEGKFAGWWLPLNLVQGLVVLGLFVWCSNESHASAAARWSLVITGVVFMTAFGLDLQKIILG